MASNDDPQPEVHEYTGLHDWAESTGVELPEPEPEAVDPADAAERIERLWACLLYTSPSPRDLSTSRMPSSA